MPFQAAYLPSQVQDLVCYKHSLETAAAGELQDPPYIDDHGLLAVDSIQQRLPQGVKEGPIATAIDPLDLIPFKRSCVSVQADLKQLSSNDSASLKRIYSDQLSWIGVVGKRAGETWFDLYANGQFNQAWLVGSTVLEQLIGNIRILKTLIGSPLTLNIRNLLWHGFIMPGDDIPLDAYGAMLIAVTMTIAHNAKAKLHTPLTIRHSNPKSFYGQRQQQDQSAPPVGDFDSTFEAISYRTTPPPVDTVQISEILLSLVSESSFVTPGTAEQWIAACRHLNSNSDYNSNFVFTMSTLPLIEHSLRLVYVTVNNCKQDRSSALIAGEYYLTLDVILDKVVPVEYFEPDSDVLLEHKDHENIPNMLYSELGAPAMNLINDLFILGLGPRLRDRTSHGELNSYLTVDVTKETWFGYYIGLIIYLLVTYIRNPGMVPKEAEHYTSWIDQYSECRFDGRSVLKKEALRCQMLLADYVDFVVNSRGETGELDSESDKLEPELGIEIIFNIDGAAVFSNAGFFSGQISIEDRLRASFSSWSHTTPIANLTTSTLSSNLPAWILIVQSIQGAIEKVTFKIRTFSEQLTLRQLSSRSRKQFENLKPLVPRLLGTLIGCLAIVERSVLTPTKIVPGSSERQDSSGSTGEVEVKLKELSVSARTSDKSNPGMSSTGATDKSSAEEILLRLKITTFVDKFVSNFDRVKLNLIEPAWEELEKSVEALFESGAK
ncbi:hypothetical protein BGZ79_009845 [Entomortierella chlamydospora]|nr:hypothetical protein BGZ79_009845 [Entomortierella chlamydospora]